MWQRFTERARRVVFFAQEEAGKLGECYVSTEHLLLGLVRENDSVAARILDRLGISLSRIRSEIERQATRGDGRLGQDMQLTPRGKRVVDLAYDEARQLSNNYIGTEHLLLGLIREGEGLAGRVLAKLDVDLNAVREHVVSLQDGSEHLMTGASRNERSADRQASRVNKAIWARLRVDMPEASVSDVKSAVDQMFSEESDWRGRSFVSLSDVSADQMRIVLHGAVACKAVHRVKTDTLRWSYPRTLGMIFEKPSLRTRVSFETGMAHLGGHAVYLAPGDIGLGARESVPDVALALSRWVDVISARVFDHKTVEELAAHASVPVINALSDREHPIQAFADLLTLQEHRGELGPNLKMAYIGDGNNVLHALLLACSKLGVNLSAACPDGYLPDPDYVQMAAEAAAETGSQISILTDPAAAVDGADALYTDVWASMGQEAEREARAKVFAPYQINSELMRHAKPDAIVLHCLPAHCGEEISEDVYLAHRSTIMDQAENRLHTQKALIALMVGM